MYVVQRSVTRSQSNTRVRSVSKSAEVCQSDGDELLPIDAAHRGAASAVSAAIGKFGIMVLNCEPCMLCSLYIMLAVS